MSTITRYYGTMDANNTLITSIDTTGIPGSSFTVDIFYGGCNMGNDSAPLEEAWLNRYILTYDKASAIVLRNTNTVLSFGFNPSASLTASLSGNNIELSTYIGSGSTTPDEAVIIYDCYLNYF